jgi:hypothetical protein
MQRRVFLLLAAILTLPAFAKAAVIGPSQSVFEFVEGTATADIEIFLTLGPGEVYTDSTLRTLVHNGTSGPAVTHVFGDDSAAITAGLLAGSIWAGGGNAGIALGDEGTTAQGNGRNTMVIYQVPGAPEPSNIEGLHTRLTFTLAGVAPGDYFVSLAGTDLNSLDENFETLPVPLQVNSFTIRVVAVPEPSTMILGGLGAAGVAVVAIRRRRRAA